MCVCVCVCVCGNSYKQWRVSQAIIQLVTLECVVSVVDSALLFVSSSPLYNEISRIARRCQDSSWVLSLISVVSFSVLGDKPPFPENCCFVLFRMQMAYSSEFRMHSACNSRIIPAKWDNFLGALALVWPIDIRIPVAYSLFPVGVISLAQCYSACAPVCITSKLSSSYRIMLRYVIPMIFSQTRTRKRSKIIFRQWRRYGALWHVPSSSSAFRFFSRFCNSY